MKIKVVTKKVNPQIHVFDQLLSGELNPNDYIADSDAQQILEAVQIIENFLNLLNYYGLYSTDREDQSATKKS